MLEITIPLCPITKKNHGRIVQKRFSNGKSVPIMLPSTQFINYQKECKKYLPKLETPIDEPINLECHYYMETKRKCDITNLLQATCDILVDHGVLFDDNYTIVASTNGTFVDYDKENPRTEIIITKKEQ